MAVLYIRIPILVSPSHSEMATETLIRQNENVPDLFSGSGYLNLNRNADPSPSTSNLAVPIENHGDFHHTLSKFSHLNLSGSVEFDNPEQYHASGGYSEIYTGVLNLSDGKKVKVAIKRLRFARRDKGICEKFVMKELYIWAKLNHINILPLRGFIIDDNINRFPSLVSDWMEEGSVLDYIKGHPGCDLRPLILGIAEGLAYLHEKDSSL
ncbi:hypothetical protein EW145_g4266 [Phellinidium pouzarii]|uniref:Protein kinase domain-containing protein n=1 Tax=Phellinidium pouzarii TaxID=167371 RepID=A0A4S4L433_9AGAM|nr:hypothetical protein EW145_g4266 [Phellinidium pouzarii]